MKIICGRRYVALSGRFPRRCHWVKYKKGFQPFLTQFFPEIEDSTKSKGNICETQWQRLGSSGSHRVRIR